MVVVMFWCHLQSICLKQVTGGTRYDEDHRSILKGVIIPESPLFIFSAFVEFWFYYLNLFLCDECKSLTLLGLSDAKI